MSDIFWLIVLIVICIVCILFLYFNVKELIHNRKINTEYRRPVSFTIVDCISNTFLVLLILGITAYIFIYINSLS